MCLGKKKVVKVNLKVVSTVGLYQVVDLSARHKREMRIGMKWLSVGKCTSSVSGITNLLGKTLLKPRLLETSKRCHGNVWCYWHLASSVPACRELKKGRALLQLPQLNCGMISPVRVT